MACSEFAWMQNIGDMGNKPYAISHKPFASRDDAVLLLGQDHGSPKED
jgi:hypothetical protein